MLPNRYLLSLCLLVASLLRAAAAEQPPKLRLNLRDGANFSGVPTTNGITVVTSYARINVPFSDMQSLAPGKNKTVSVVFPNGDILKGTSTVNRIRFKTEFGTMAIGLRHIHRLAIPENAKFPYWINDGLVAYYKFDGDANDSGAHKYHGSVHGAVPATDRFNNPKRAYRIEEKNFVMLSHKTVEGLRNFTISVWVYFDRLNTGAGNPGNAILSVATRDTVNEFLLARGMEGDGIGLNLKGDRYGWYEFKNGAVEERQWHHIVLTRQRSNITLYIDGKEKDSTIGQPDQITADYTGVIVGQEQDKVGGGFQTYQSLTGKIDDLRIYGRALSAIKVQRLYESEKKEY